MAKLATAILHSPVECPGKTFSGAFMTPVLYPTKTAPLLYNDGKDQRQGHNIGVKSEFVQQSYCPGSSARLFLLPIIFQLDH
jgi:hypothetical protein